MKKLFIIILLAFTLSGCDTLAVNEIYNKTYNSATIDLNDFEDLIIEIAENSSRSVVGISKYRESFLGQESLQYTGSGVVTECKAKMADKSEKSCLETLDSDQVSEYIYQVVTNRHVLEEKDGSIRRTGLSIKVYLGDEGLEKDAELIDYSKSYDLAVLRFRHHKYIQPLKYGNSDQLKTLNYVIAIGNPAGHDYYGTTTLGNISGPIRTLTDDNGNKVNYIQHSAPINSGSSGGALLNLEGELIGINTLKLTASDEDNVFENMGFAIPSNRVLEIVNSLDNFYSN